MVVFPLTSLLSNECFQEQAASVAFRRMTFKSLSYLMK